MEQTEAKKLLAEVLGSENLMMNSPYVTLSFAENENRVRSELLEKIMSSDNLNKALAEEYTNSISNKIGLSSLRNNITELFPD